MHSFEYELSFDVYTPDPNNSQTEPISFYPEIYSDLLGSQEQWSSRESCVNDNQAQFRLVAENLQDQGTVISYPV